MDLRKNVDVERPAVEQVRGGGNMLTGWGPEDREINGLAIHLRESDQ